jgi:hypothetical protein
MPAQANLSGTLISVAGTETELLKVRNRPRHNAKWMHQARTFPEFLALPDPSRNAVFLGT